MTLNVESRPARGAWIETPLNMTYNIIFKSRPARGAWIETCHRSAPISCCGGRAPHGARGLKQRAGQMAILHQVAPRTGRVD